MCVCVSFTDWHVCVIHLPTHRRGHGRLALALSRGKAEGGKCGCLLGRYCLPQNRQGRICWAVTTAPNPAIQIPGVGCCTGNSARIWQPARARLKSGHRIRGIWRSPNPSPRHASLREHNQGASLGEIQAPCVSAGWYLLAVAQSFMHSFTGKLRCCDITGFRSGF